jgi:hypothetical protein
VIDNKTKEDGIKFYSQRAISIATYLGGPLAAGILVRKNYLNLDKEEKAKNSLILGILLTVALLITIFSIPTEIMDKIPNAVIPAIYTLIIYFIVEKLQGQDLKDHKKNDGQFYSAWKATGIGAICSIIFVVGAIGYAFLLPEDFDSSTYDERIAEFGQNEEEALQLFDMLGKSDNQSIVDFIDKTGIPNWKKNVTLLNKLDKLEGLTDEFVKQNQIFREYSQLRIESFALIKKAVMNQSAEYDKQIESINTKIDSVLNGL